ncbi:MAG: hypothetical protein ACXWNK_05930 [Vulcanimicrobiaceae bacterium]
MRFYRSSIYGAASGIMQTPAIASAMETAAAERQSTAGAMQRLVQNLGIGCGSLLAAVLLKHRGSAAVWCFASVICKKCRDRRNIGFVLHDERF